MDRRSIEIVLRKLGAVDFRLSGDHIMTNCIYAPYTDGHKSNFDRNPSAGVKITRGVSPYHCFACGKKGGLLQVAKEVGKMALTKGDITKEDYEEIISFILLAEEESMASDVSIEGVGIKNLKPVPKEMMDAIGTGHEYFKQRGIIEEEIKEWGLGYVEWITDEGKEKLVDRVIIPVFDKEGNVPLVQTRVIDDKLINKKNPKYKNYPQGSVKTDYLYGEHLITDDTKYLVVVEGMLDAIKGNRALKEHGMFPEYVVVAVMGADVSDTQADKLVNWSIEIIDGLDNDSAGKLGSKRLFENVWKRKTISKIEYPEGVKDADEFITKFGTKSFIDLIHNRKLKIFYQLPLKEVKFI